MAGIVGLSVLFVVAVLILFAGESENRHWGLRIAGLASVAAFALALYFVFFVLLNSHTSSAGQEGATMTRTRQLILILAVVAVIAVAALFFIGTQVPGILDIRSGGPLRP